VVVTPHPAEIDGLARDLALFTDLPVAQFPAWESEPGERVVHDEIYGDRLRVLKQLSQPPALPGDSVASGHDEEPEQDDVPGCGAPIPRRSRGLTGGCVGDAPSLIVTSIQSMLQPVPGREALAAATREVRVGGLLDEQEMARWLVDHGAHSTTAVELPGEFALRGGILDVFPPDADDPLRIELFGDQVESIRRFDVASQRTDAFIIEDDKPLAEVFHQVLERRGLSARTFSGRAELEAVPRQEWADLMILDLSLGESEHRRDEREQPIRRVFDAHQRGVVGWVARSYQVARRQMVSRHNPRR